MTVEPCHTLAEAAFLSVAVLADCEREPDPVTRFRLLTKALEEHDWLVSRIADERAACATEMHAFGLSFAEIAAQLGGTRARAQQLVERGRKVRASLPADGPKGRT